MGWQGADGHVLLESPTSITWKEKWAFQIFVYRKHNPSVILNSSEIFLDKTRSFFSRKSGEIGKDNLSYCILIICRKIICSVMTVFEETFADQPSWVQIATYEFWLK